MVECLNHYLVYLVLETEFPQVDVNLKDQFIPDGEDATVWGPYYFANPVQKTVVGSSDVAEIEDPDLHWVLYDIEDGQPTSIGKTIQIANQFGDDQILDLTYRDTLAVPSQKIAPPVPLLDHFKCYWASGPTLQGVYVDYIEDQFGYFENVEVLWASQFCNPVEKVHGAVTTPIANPDNHLTVYDINVPQEGWNVVVDNQFGSDQELTVIGPVALAVPTQKLDPGAHGLPKYLDHYLLYMVMAGLFESLRQPFIIIFAVPLAAIGVVLMFTLSQSNVDVSAMVGVIMLLAWATPVLAGALPAVRDAWRRTVHPWWSATHERVDDALASLRRPVVATVAGYYGDSLNLGRGGELSDTVILVVQSPSSGGGVRYYWRARVYDDYADGQWNSDIFTTTKSVPPTGLGLTFPELEGRRTITFTFTSPRREATFTIWPSFKPSPEASSG